MLFLPNPTQSQGNQGAECLNSEKSHPRARFSDKLLTRKHLEGSRTSYLWARYSEVICISFSPFSKFSEAVLLLYLEKICLKADFIASR